MPMATMAVAFRADTHGNMSHMIAPLLSAVARWPSRFLQAGSEGRQFVADPQSRTAA